MMLMYMLGAMVERTFQAPQELYPPPDMSPAALAPKLWTPHTLTAACSALLSTSQGSLLGTSKNFVFRITNPSTCEEIEVAAAVGDSVASRADLDAILRNMTCMDAVWKVLEHHSPVGAHILSFLVTRAKSTGPGCPASLSHLLRMGAAKPLTAALTQHYKGLDEEQQQHKEQGLPPQMRCLDDPESHLAVLFLLLSVMKRASKEDHHGTWRHEWTKEVAWPGALVQAHILALIKVIEIEHLCPRISFAGSYINELMAYPPASRPTAASMLAHQPEYLDKLVCFLGRVAAAIPTAKTEAIEVCMLFSVVFSILLEARGTELKCVLPIQPFIASLTTAIQNTAKQLMQPPHSLQTVTAGCPYTVQQCMDDHFAPLQMIAALLTQVLTLQGTNEKYAFVPSFVESVMKLAGASGAPVYLPNLLIGSPLTCVPGVGGDEKQGVPYRTCMACGKTAQGLKACGRCKAAFFCDAQCQRRSWPSHRSQCATCT